MSSDKRTAEALALLRLFLGIVVVAVGSVCAWLFQNTAWPPSGRVVAGSAVGVLLVVVAIVLLHRAVKVLNQLGGEPWN